MHMCGVYRRRGLNTPLCIQIPGGTGGQGICILTCPLILMQLPSIHNLRNASRVEPLERLVLKEPSPTMWPICGCFRGFDFHLVSWKPHPCKAQVSSIGLSEGKSLKSHDLPNSGYIHDMTLGIRE